MTSAITVAGVSKAFGSHCVINSLSLSIGRGCVYGLVGLNGAGKTTLLRLLLGILEPDAGEIRILGAIPWNHETTLYRRCGVVLESDGFWGNLSAAENCSVYAAAKGVGKQELASYLDEFWSTSDLFTSGKHVKNFSRGQRMQCALCRAFMGNPDVCFLDEPALALDLNAYDLFKKLVFAARSRGAAVIVSSHQLETIDELCDRAGILRDGTITEINRSRDTLCSQWFIDTSGEDAIAEIIKNAGGTDVGFDAGWRFTIADCETRIPGIIRAIAGAGFDIREARPDNEGFGTAIRTIYASSSKRETA